MQQRHNILLMGFLHIDLSEFSASVNFDPLCNFKHCKWRFNVLPRIKVKLLRTG